MSHESVLTGLKSLMRRDLFETPPHDYTAQVRGESDRSTIILLAAFVETHLSVVLRDKMGGLNSDEMTRVFDFNGPLGTFSDRIWLAQALGVIDRPTRRQLDVVREMRNVAAHAHPAITFDTPEIKAAAVQLFEPDVRQTLDALSGSFARKAFVYLCAYLAAQLTSAQDLETPSDTMRRLLKRLAERLKPSPEK